MSNVGLGAFVQGLTQGYVAGDKLQSAEEDRETSRQVRELRGLQIGEERRKATERAELDALRPQMSEAIGNVLAKPTDETALQTYNDVMAKYYAKANPNDAAVFVKSVKEDKLKEGARQAANIFGRLQMRDETAIADFAKAYKAVPTGVDVDPARSGFTKDGGIKLGLFNTENGQALPDRVVTNDQVVQGFAQFLGSGKDVVDFYQTNRRLNLVEDNINKDFDVANRGLGLRAREANQRDQDRDELRFNKAFESERDRLDKVYAPRIQQLKSDIELGTGGPKAREQLRALQNEQAAIGSILADNWNIGNKASANEIAANLTQLRNPEYIKQNFIGTSKSAEGYGYVKSPNGRRILVQIPDSLGLNKKTQ